MLPFDQLDLFGTYVSPLVAVMVGCAAVWLLVRQIADALSLLPHIWHPALFFSALYVIILSVVGSLIGHAAMWAAP